MINLKPNFCLICCVGGSQTRVALAKGEREKASWRSHLCCVVPACCPLCWNVRAPKLGIGLGFPPAFPHKIRIKTLNCEAPFLWKASWRVACSRAPCSWWQMGLLPPCVSVQWECGTERPDVHNWLQEPAFPAGLFLLLLPHLTFYRLSLLSRLSYWYLKTSFITYYPFCVQFNAICICLWIFYGLLEVESTESLQRGLSTVF